MQVKGKGIRGFEELSCEICRVPKNIHPAAVFRTRGICLDCRIMQDAVWISLIVDMKFSSYNALKGLWFYHGEFKQV